MTSSKKTLVTALATAALFVVSLSANADDRRKVKTASRTATSATAATFSTEVNFVQRTSPPNGGQSNTLVLNAAAGHPFNVTLVATNQHANPPVQGNGLALPQTDVFGYFSFPTITQNPSNPEVFIKILDARSVNGHYWVFYGGLTDLQYVLNVTEVATNITKQYTKAPGDYEGGADTSAFAGASVTSNTEATQIAPNAYVRTAVDISNNTSSTITADLQYAYTCTDPTCGVVGQFKRTTDGSVVLNIPPFETQHFDDIVNYFDSQSLLLPGAGLGSTGTLLVSFGNLPSAIGGEATATARVYNRISQVDPLRGTVGFDENGSIFFESTLTTLTGTAVDTRSAPVCTSPGNPSGCTYQGSLLTQVGVVNTDLNLLGDNNPAYVRITCYNPTTGQPVGNPVTLSSIFAGETRFVSDLWSVAGVPANINNVIVFVDTVDSGGHLHPAGTPTIEGFLLVQDTISLDTRFNEMRCADQTHCGF
jgi:FlaG/FlaF family flagellin (archaellin)